VGRLSGRVPRDGKESDAPVWVTLARVSDAVGVVYEDTRANAIRWYQERGGDWTNVMDPRGRMAIDYGVRGVPETFFITRDRRILLHLPKPVTYDVLELWASKILAPDSTTAAPS